MPVFIEEYKGSGVVRLAPADLVDAGFVASGPAASVGADGSGKPRPEGAVLQETTIRASARREARPAVRRGGARREPDVARLFSASTG